MVSTNPVVRSVQKTNHVIAYSTTQYPTYFDAYKGATPSQNVIEFQIGNRLIPRSVVSSNPDGLVTAVLNIAAKGALIVGVTTGVAKKAGAIDNSVNPAWRDTAFEAFVGTPNPPKTAGETPQQYLDGLKSAHSVVTNQLIPELTKLTPGVGAAYLNEADWNDPNWKQVFYGSNYNKLSLIKDKYDPQGIFYALTGVGSDAWAVRSDGRLCRTGNVGKY